MLDAQAGVQYDGEDPPEATHDEAMAIRIFNALSNGMGGVDWSGLPLWVAHFGITDITGLLHRLLVIKGHRRPDDAAAEPDTARSLA